MAGGFLTDGDVKGVSIEKSLYWTDLLKTHLSMYYIYLQTLKKTWRINEISYRDHIS